MNANADGLFHTRLRASSSRLFWVGLALTLLGVAAIVFPVVSTLAAALFAGWVFLFSGVLLLIGSFSIHGTGPFFGALLISLLSIAAGAFLVFNPFAGAFGLTVFLVVLFLIEGSFEIVFAFEMRPNPGWTWMLISGLASVILGLLIAAGLPGTSLIALGVLLGINFLSTGLGYLLVSRAVRSA
ncbi:MAG: HdeD family acid-resistance protein [Rhizomicrobium sp.]